MDYSKRVFKGHSWIHLIGSKRQCTKCGTIRIQGKEKPLYIKNGVEYDKAPDCASNILQ